jgi:hypothetical protein
MPFRSRVCMGWFAVVRKPRANPSQIAIPEGPHRPVGASSLRATRSLRRAPFLFGALTHQTAMSKSPNIKAAQSTDSIVESEVRVGSPWADLGELQTHSAVSTRIARLCDELVSSRPSNSTLRGFFISKKARLLGCVRASRALQALGAAEPRGAPAEASAFVALVDAARRGKYSVCFFAPL